MLWKVPVLVGLIVLGTHIWTTDNEFLDGTKDLDYFVASVEFAVAQFNDNNPEENTYRLLEVERAQKKVSLHAEHCPLMKSPRLGVVGDGHQQGLVSEESTGPAEYSIVTDLETLSDQGHICFFSVRLHLGLLLDLDPGPKEPLVSNTLPPQAALQLWRCRPSSSYGTEYGGVERM